jgi:AraC family transcriptional regulator
MTPSIFILNRRIAKAQELMVLTQDSLSAIALACGLADQSHFTRRFVQVTGVTPSRWRRDQRHRIVTAPQSSVA